LVERGEFRTVLDVQLRKQDDDEEEIWKDALSSPKYVESRAGVDAKGDKKSKTGKQHQADLDCGLDADSPVAVARGRTRQRQTAGSWHQRRAWSLQPLQLAGRTIYPQGFLSQ
jgi:hypothetical protein